MTTTDRGDGAAYASVSERASPEWHAGFRAGMAVALSTHTAQPLTYEQAEHDAAMADAARWRYWRNYWPALCRMEVARFAGLDLRTTYVQDPAGMDRVTDEAMTRHNVRGNAGPTAAQKED